MALAAALASVGCYSAGEGISPPLDTVYFPVGLALTPDAAHLAIVNSDFDLQFNAGTLNVVDVARLGAFVPQPCASDADCAGGDRDRCDDTRDDGTEPSFFCVDASNTPCGSLGERSLSDQLLVPGRCNQIDPQRPPAGDPLFSDSVEIGAFATDIVFRARPPRFGDTSIGRLFIPVRGDATLHWADIDANGRLDCGQAANQGACDDYHRAGNDPDAEGTRDLRLGAEPFALDVSPDGDAVLVTNQTSGTVSVFSNDWGANGALGNVTLQFAVSNLQLRPVGVAALATPALMKVQSLYYPPGFLVSYRSAAQIDLIRYFSDQQPLGSADSSSPIARPYASLTNSVPITVNSSGIDSRGIALDASARGAAERDCFDDAGVADTCVDDASCLAGLTSEQQTALISCLSAATSVPLDVYVANRAPPSLLVGRTTPVVNALQNTELPAFYDSIALANGPSRVTVGSVLVGNDGDEPLLEPRVFVSCFDSRRIFVYDPARRMLDLEITTGRGPYALAVDNQHHWLFVGSFTDSFVSVVSLDRRFARTYGRTLATIGIPTPPRTSK